MKRLIIESPYAGDVERNVLYARRCVAHALSRGRAPLCSHLLYTQPGILDDKKPSERELGINAGFEWTAVAEEVWVYTDYGTSSGMQRGVNLAQALKIPVAWVTIGKNPTTPSTPASATPDSLSTPSL